MADEFNKLEHFSISPGAQLAGSTKLHINRIILILITSLHTNTNFLKDLEPSSHNLTTYCPPPPNRFRKHFQKVGGSAKKFKRGNVMLEKVFSPLTI